MDGIFLALRRMDCSEGWAKSKRIVTSIFLAMDLIGNIQNRRSDRRDPDLSGIADSDKQNLIALGTVHSLQPESGILKSKCVIPNFKYTVTLQSHSAYCRYPSGLYGANRDFGYFSKSTELS